MKNLDIILITIMIISSFTLGVLTTEQFFDKKLIVISNCESDEFIIYDSNYEHIINLNERNGYIANNFFVVKLIHNSIVRKIPDVQRTTLHEFAHYLDLYYFKNKDEWIKTFNQSTEFISEYAKKSPEEDFAESFRYVMSFCYNEQKFNDLQKEKSDLLKPFIKQNWGECNGN